MNKLLQCLLLTLLIVTGLTLSGCGPIYTTRYTYEAPRGNNAHMCLMQCNQVRSMCQQMCSMKSSNCKAQAQQLAQQSYEQYATQRQLEHKKVKKTVNDFYDPFSCGNTDNCHCTENYNGCFSACGGQVIAHRVCTAFCNKK